MASSWTPPTFTIEDQHNAYLEKAKKAQFIFEGRVIGYEIHQIGNKGFPKCYIRRKVQITKIYKGHDSLPFKTVEIVSGPDYCSGPSSDSTFVTVCAGQRDIYICNINKQPVPPAVNFTAEIPLRLHKIAFYHLKGFGDIEKQFIHKLKQLPGIEVKTQKSNKNSFKSTAPSKKNPGTRILTASRLKYMPG